jgi:hypothetical protein
MKKIVQYGASELVLSPNISRKKIIWAEHAACMKVNGYRILVGKQKGKRPPRRHRRRREGNIEVALA